MDVLWRCQDTRPFTSPDRERDVFIDIGSWEPADVQIIGAMAEFERSLIQERVRAGGLETPKLTGKGWVVLADVDETRIETLRASGPLA